MNEIRRAMRSIVGHRPPVRDSAIFGLDKDKDNFAINLSCAVLLFPPTSLPSLVCFCFQLFLPGHLGEWNDCDGKTVATRQKDSINFFSEKSEYFLSEGHYSTYGSIKWMMLISRANVHLRWSTGCWPVT